MRPVFKFEMFRASKPEVSLMNQRGRLQGVTGTLRSHFVGRDGAQFGINLFIEQIQGTPIFPGPFSHEAVQVIHVAEV